MKTFPTLFKKTTKDTLVQWTIEVCDPKGHNGDPSIVVQHGQVGGKIQATQEFIRDGKNIGKANETSPYEQALAEAQAKYEKQLKKCYVTTVKAALAGETDDLIEGGINPMLAHPFSKHGHKIKYPCYAQPKLDGIRCIAILKDGECNLWSRTRKLITGLPHIAHEIEVAFPGHDLILDGELYNHDFKKDFEKIVSFVRQEEPAEGHEVVQYHIYDTVLPQFFKDRAEHLVNLFHGYEKSIGNLKHLYLVSTCKLDSEDKIEDTFSSAISMGFEGLMLRNADGLYENKRSYGLQKVKEFDDSEFPILNIEEGRGKLAGHAIFVCKNKDGTTFQVKMKGATERLKEFFDNHSLWEGKQLTVQYQGLTAYNVPRFPVGIAVRDYE